MSHTVLINRHTAPCCLGSPGTNNRRPTGLSQDRACSVALGRLASSPTPTASSREAIRPCQLPQKRCLIRGFVRPCELPMPALIVTDQGMWPALADHILKEGCDLRIANQGMVLSSSQRCFANSHEFQSPMSRKEGPIEELALDHTPDLPGTALEGRFCTGPIRIPRWAWPLGQGGPSSRGGWI